MERKKTTMKHGKPRMDHMHFKALVPKNVNDPVMQVNGVQFTSTEYSFTLSRLKEMDKKGYAGDGVCLLCGRGPCISAAAGSQPLLDFAKALRDRGVQFKFIRDQCVRYMLNSSSFKEAYVASEQKEIPECVVYWVENRCCMGANW